MTRRAGRRGAISRWRDLHVALSAIFHARSRLQWLQRQLPSKFSEGGRPAHFYTQPYVELAQVLHDEGDDAGRKDVLVAIEDGIREYSNPRPMSWWPPKWVAWGFGWLWGGFLKYSVGYGYKPYYALGWIVAFVILGTFLFSWGHSAEVITQTEKDSSRHYRPFNSFIYSLETFIPLVDLQQGKHWAPEPQRRGRSRKAPLLKPLARVLASCIKPLGRVSIVKFLLKPRHQFGPNWGRQLRLYLWVHILAGWFFALMLVAAVSGLVHSG